MISDPCYTFFVVPLFSLNISRNQNFLILQLPNSSSLPNKSTSTLMNSSTTIIIHTQVCKLQMTARNLYKMNLIRVVHDERTHCSSNIVTIYITTRKRHLTEEKEKGRNKSRWICAYGSRVIFEQWQLSIFSYLFTLHLIQLTCNLVFSRNNAFHIFITFRYIQSFFSKDTL